MWCEVNARVNYPIKIILVQMLEQGKIVIDNPLHLFCVSWFVIQVASVGIKLFIKAWNHHTIPGNDHNRQNNSLWECQLVVTRSI